LRQYCEDASKFDTVKYHTLYIKQEDFEKMTITAWEQLVFLDDK
jgi:hypothetical protein